MALKFVRQRDILFDTETNSLVLEIQEYDPTIMFDYGGQIRRLYLPADIVQEAVIDGIDVVGWTQVHPPLPGEEPTPDPEPDPEPTPDPETEDQTA